MIDIKDFGKPEMRIGKILSADLLEGAKIPAYKLVIDFGGMGRKKSSAQLTDLYTPEDLIGRKVVAVTNFESKKIAGFTSEILVLGVPNENGAIVLLSPDKDIREGSKVS